MGGRAVTVKSNRQEMARRLGIPLGALDQYLQQKEAESNEPKQQLHPVLKRLPARPGKKR